MAFATLVRFWLFRVIEKDSQIVRAASRRARGSDQSAGPNVWAACRPPRTDATKDPSSASAGVITTSCVPTRTVWGIIGRILNSEPGRTEHVFPERSPNLKPRTGDLPNRK